MMRQTSLNRLRIKSKSTIEQAKKLTQESLIRIIWGLRSTLMMKLEMHLGIESNHQRLSILLQAVLLLLILNNLTRLNRNSGAESVKELLGQELVEVCKKVNLHIRESLLHLNSNNNKQTKTLLLATLVQRPSVSSQTCRKIQSRVRVPSTAQRKRNLEQCVPTPI